MTYPAYEIDLRDGTYHIAKWRQQAAPAQRRARNKPDDAAQHTANARKWTQYAWDSRRRWIRARRVEPIE